jgi:MoaA/NifB/PqqE/SkfB family radical SAM enzyme
LRRHEAKPGLYEPIFVTRDSPRACEVFMSASHPLPLRDVLDFAGFFAGRVLLRRRDPLLASFKITWKCNLACRGCPFHQRGKRPGSSMDWDTVRRSLDALAEMGTRILVFEGGEPFLWRDGERTLEDAVLYAKERFTRVAVTTNGTLPLDSPADILWVSLDGPKETHDRLRSGSFDRVLKNLAETRHPRVLAHITVHRENRCDLEPLLATLREIPAVRGVTFQFFYPYGQGEAPLSLTRAERREAVEEIVALKRRGFPVLNDEGRLRAVAGGRWRCHDDVLANVDPDGTVTRGCYVKNRGAVRCSECGFTPVAEASGAVDLLPGSLRAGWSVFLSRT